MRFLAWQVGDPLVAGPSGLLQPAADTKAVVPDTILVPLIGFDRALNRLGQGAGYYDRAFATLTDARRIGLAWSVQELSALPCDPWDEPLHAIATERGWIEPSPDPSWRKPAGAFAIIALIIVWTVAVVSLSGEIARLPTIVQAIIYLVAGVVWILPLRPLLVWMEGANDR